MFALRLRTAPFSAVEALGRHRAGRIRRFTGQHPAAEVRRIAAAGAERWMG